METRQINQVRIYVLILNTFGRAEEGIIAAISDDYDRLVNWYYQQLSKEYWRDDSGFWHSFKPDSPLVNLNPCFNLELNNTNHFGHGIHDEWINEDVFLNIRDQYTFV